MGTPTAQGSEATASRPIGKSPEVYDHLAVVVHGGSGAPSVIGSPTAAMRRGTRGVGGCGQPQCQLPPLNVERVLAQCHVQSSGRRQRRPWAWHGGVGPSQLDAIASTHAQPVPSVVARPTIELQRDRHLTHLILVLAHAAPRMQQAAKEHAALAAARVPLRASAAATTLTAAAATTAPAVVYALAAAATATSLGPGAAAAIAAAALSHTAPGSTSLMASHCSTHGGTYARAACARACTDALAHTLAHAHTLWKRFCRDDDHAAAAAKVMRSMAFVAVARPLTV